MLCIFFREKTTFQRTLNSRPDINLTSFNWAENRDHFSFQSYVATNYIVCRKVTIVELRRPEQVEPHTHMGKKRKPINESSHGYHG